jgi:hypothetical protein
MADHQQQVRKAVHTFRAPKLEEEGSEHGSADVFAFRHELGTKDVLVQVLDRRGRPLKQVEVTVQNGDIVVVKNPYDWTDGDKIVVMG